MKFSTALRQPTRRKLEHLEKADIVIGLPCYNNETTIANVLETVEKGLTLHFPHHKSLILVTDGGSVDDTREESQELDRIPGIERLTSIYRGIPGKGSAVRAIFEAAHMLQAQVCVLFDSDIRSITTEWVKSMIEPVLNQSYDFITPYYTRYKYDGTITNNIVYSFTRTLYGVRVRQPIGGDFSFSLPLIKQLINKDVWETDVARFGIDIWLTTNAIIHKAKIAQANLGVKIHDVKEPAETLEPMFKQVVKTLFNLMEENENVWKNVHGSTPVPILGPKLNITPQPFTIDVRELVEQFRIGYTYYKEVWKKIISPDIWQYIELLYTKKKNEFIIETEQWVKIMYDLAVAFHHWKGNRKVMIQLMVPLYFAKVASFVNATQEMDNEQAEAFVENQASLYEKHKNYLIQEWGNETHAHDMVPEG
jgi:glycosyltransferase involved in cell wall biosynthesis